MIRLYAFTVVIAAIAIHVLARTYTTNFPLNENSISEGGNWINSTPPIRTNNGLAYGTQTGLESHPPYNDPVAVLSGAWGPDQAAWGTVHTVNQKGGNIYEEVELSLRMTIAPTALHGYNVDYKCSHDGSQYVEIGYWKGSPGNVIGSNPSEPALAQGWNPVYPGLHDSDIIKATAIGNVITVYLNGVQILQYTDTDPTHTHDGAPGIGFYLQGISGVNTDYGFTSFTATDGVTSAIDKMQILPVNPQPMKPRLILPLSGGSGLYIRVVYPGESIREPGAQMFDLSGHELITKKIGFSYSEGNQK
jgi:hypothetical protein